MAEQGKARKAGIHEQMNKMNKISNEDIKWLKEHKKNIEIRNSILEGFAAFLIWAGISVLNYFLLKATAITFETAFMEFVLALVFLGMMKALYTKKITIKDVFALTLAFTIVFVSALTLAFTIAFVSALTLAFVFAMTLVFVFALLIDD